MQISDPKTNENAEFFLSEKETPELLMNVMNKLCFNKTASTTQLDGNFISIYNEKDNRFHYYAHRLKGLLNIYTMSFLNEFLRGGNRKRKGTHTRENVGCLHQ